MRVWIEMDGRTVSWLETLRMYEELKEQRVGSLLLTISQFEKLLIHIENQEWHPEDNPHPTYVYQGNYVMLHL